MIELLIALFSAIAGAGGLYGGNLLYTRARNRLNLPQDQNPPELVPKEVCSIVHKNVDEKLSSISENVQEIGKSVRRLEVQQSRFLSMDGPIARIRKEVEEDLGEHIKKYHKAS